MRILPAALLASVALWIVDASGQSKPQQRQAPAAQSAQPRDMMVAPNAPRQQPEPVQSGGQVQSTGAPANVCQELVAYIRQANQQPSGQKETGGAARPATESAGPGQTAPAVDRPQQQSGQSAPIPSAPHAAGANVSTDQAQSWEDANDFRACQAAAQQMRRAGLALPPGLLALSALREDLLTRSRPASAR